MSIIIKICVIIYDRKLTRVVYLVIIVMMLKLADLKYNNNNINKTKREKKLSNYLKKNFNYELDVDFCCFREFSRMCCCKINLKLI